MRDDAAAKACAECLPGDVLVMLGQNTNKSNVRPFLCREPQRGVICAVPFEARALVICRLVSLLTSWVLVLCEGRIGWVDQSSVERLEAVQPHG